MNVEESVSMHLHAFEQRQIVAVTKSPNAPHIFLNVKFQKLTKALDDYNGIRTHNHLVCKQTLKHLAKLAKWLSFVVSTINSVLLSCHIGVWSESALFNCLNVKELLARSRRDSWKISDCNWIGTGNI